MGEVGREVRRLREAKGWGQTKLAAAADMAVSGVSQIENGHRNPNSATLIKLARALGVEVADLFPKGQAPLPLNDVAGTELLERALDAARRDMRRESETISRLHASEGLPQSMTGFAEDEVRRELSAAGFPDEHFEGIFWPLVVRLVRAEQATPPDFEDERRESVYGPWLEFVNRYADRWERRIEAGDFDLGSFEEFRRVYEEIEPVLLKLNARELREFPATVPDTFGGREAITGRAIWRLLDLLTPMLDAGATKFANADTERMRRKREGAERLRKAASG